MAAFLSAELACLERKAQGVPGKRGWPPKTKAA